MSERHPVQRLLLEAFPKWRDLASDCSIRRAFEADQNFEPELIGRIEALGAWDALIGRIQVKHPVGVSHLALHDLDLFSVWTEARAAVWADTAGLGIPKFTETEGEPDLKIDSGWVEAKRILRSDADREAAVLAREKNPITGFRMADPIGLSPKFVTKFESHFDKAMSQWGRQGQTGSLIVYVEVSTDLGVSPDEAFESLKAAASSAVTKEPRVRVVLSEDAGRMFDTAIHE